MRSVTVRLDDLRNIILNLGFVGENEHRQFRFDSMKMFGEYPNASVSMTVCPPEGDAYPATIERDGDFVIWTITDSDLVAEGDGEIQITFTESPHIAKTYIGRTKTSRSLVPTGEIPSGLDDFITRADALLDQVEETFPAGGTTGQVLAKKSDADYDTEWVDQGGGGTSDYEELDNLPQIGGVTLKGNKTLHDLGAAAESDIPDVSGFYTKPADGIPAADIASGVIPVLTDLIDDTAGDGVTNKVWSADKSHELLTEITNKYEKPTGGIPSSDMTEAVQTSLGKADSAYQKPSGGIPGTDLADSYIKEGANPRYYLKQTVAENCTTYGQTQLVFNSESLNIWEEFVVLIYRGDTTSAQNIADSDWNVIYIHDTINNNNLLRKGYAKGDGPVMLRYKRFPNAITTELIQSTASSFFSQPRSSDYVDKLDYLMFDTSGHTLYAGTTFECFIRRFI